MTKLLLWFFDLVFVFVLVLRALIRLALVLRSVAAARAARDVTRHRRGVALLFAGFGDSLPCLRPLLPALFGVHLYVGESALQTFLASLVGIIDEGHVLAALVDRLALFPVDLIVGCFI